MRPMYLLAALLGPALLAGCMGAEKTAAAPQAATAPAAPVEPEMIVQLNRTGQAARDTMVELAARCWLDGIVLGAQLIVKPDGNLVIVDETQDLVAAEYVDLQGQRTRWRLTGTAIADAEQTRQIVQSIDRASATGETACPQKVG